MVDLQHKYDVLLMTFAAFLCQQTGCDQKEAALLIANLCTVVQTEVFDKVGRPIPGR